MIESDPICTSTARIVISRMLAAAPCDAPLAEAARYNPDSMPQLKIR